MSIISQAAALAALIAVSGAGTAVSAAGSAPSSAPVVLTGKWQVDNAHSSVTFAIRHFGLSTVHGRFATITGAIVADKKHPDQSSVNVTIPVSSINTDMTMRDNDLKSPQFFDADKYPNITFVSTSIQAKGKDSYVAIGALTIHGVTHSVALPFTLEGPIRDPFGTPRFGLTSELTIQRTDYGMTAYTQKLPNGEMAVGNDVHVTINVEAVPQGTPSM